MILSAFWMGYGSQDSGSDRLRSRFLMPTSVVGTKRTCRNGRLMSAPGGETDVRQLGRDVRVWTLNGHSVGIRRCVRERFWNCQSVPMRGRVMACFDP